MTCTIERPTLDSVTSVIFPSTPAKLKIHQTPKNADFLAYRVDDFLTISAWMPDNLYKVSLTQTETNNHFYSTHCMGCERNCFDFHQDEDYLDENGEFDGERTPGGFHCFVYDEGYSGQQCPEGYEKDTDTLEFNVANMVFEMDFSFSGNGRLARRGDSAYLCKGVFNSNTKRILATDVMMASNVFGSGGDIEGICWGNNPRPNTLKGIADSFFSSTFNNDLTPISAFEENSEEIRSSTPSDQIPDKFLCRGVDAIAMLDVEYDLQAFFTFLTAGFNSLPEIPHIMLVPLFEDKLEVEGQVYSGYKTIRDAVGRQWFITYDGQLLGQV